MKAVMNVPAPAQSRLPPAVDAPQTPRGTLPLGSSALSTTLTVDAYLVGQRIAQGWTVSSWVAAS